MVGFSAKDFLALGLTIAGFNRWQSYKQDANTERFTKKYGAIPQTCADIWSDLEQQELLNDEEAKHPVRLLIALRFLWAYEYEHDLGSFFNLTEKTVRQHARVWVKKIEMLLPLKIGELEDYTDEVVGFLLSIDGVHVPIEEPRPFSTIWSSHKLGGSAGVNYELALLINRPQLAWVYGPLPPGKYNDISTFRRKLKALFEWLFPGKRIVGDKGYRGEKDIISTRNDYDPAEIAEWKDRVLARHETFNQSIKCFQCFTVKWRHGVENHGVAFRAVCAIVMYQIENDTFMLFDPYF